MLVLHDGLVWCVGECNALWLPFAPPQQTSLFDNSMSCSWQRLGILPLWLCHPVYTIVAHCCARSLLNFQIAQISAALLWPLPIA